jgi:D-glycero-alpha-D-manno-heptose-7-phosphate kinase
VFEKEGGGVISATIDRYSHAFLVRRNDRQIGLHSLDFNQHVLLKSPDEIRYDGVLDLLKAAIRVVRPAFGFDLYTYSEVPPGSGLGSSSAMTVAIVGLLYELSEGQLDRYRIADLAYQAERVELGMQGGWQDQYAAAFGGFNFIEFDRHDVTVHSLRLSEPMLYELESNLLLCFTGQTRDSGQVHAAQQRRARSNSAMYRQVNSEILKLVTATKKALLKGDLVEFGRLLDVAWQTKKNLAQGVSNNFIDRLYAIAREQGASGGKLLGAGSGGFLLFYCQPLKHHLVKQALEQEGAAITTFKFDPKGLQVWHSPHPPEMDEACKP